MGVMHLNVPSVFVSRSARRVLVHSLKSGMFGACTPIGLSPAQQNRNIARLTSATRVIQIAWPGHIKSHPR